MRIEIDREKLGQIVLVLQGGGALGAYQAGGWRERVSRRDATDIEFPPQHYDA